MLQTIESQLTRVVTRPLLSTVNTAVEEGTCLMGTYDSDGQLVVSPCAGNNTDLFVGFAVGEIAAPTTLVAVETFSVTAPTAAEKRTLTLGHTFSTGTASIRSSFTKTWGTMSPDDTLTGAANDHWHVTGTTLSVWLDTNDTGTITFTYRYTPTVVDIRRVQGDVHPGQHVTLDRRQVGVIESGEILFDMFDTTADYSAASVTTVTTAATGRVRASGGKVIPGVITRKPFHSDNAETALMGLSFSI